MRRGEREAAPEKPERKRMGNTDRLALLLVLLLAAGLAGGFILAVLSIRAQYMGALACWTAAFAPIGSVCAAVLVAIVNKNKAENTAGGVKYAAAEASGFVENPTI